MERGPSFKDAVREEEDMQIIPKQHAECRGGGMLGPGGLNVHLGVRAGGRETTAL